MSKTTCQDIASWCSLSYTSILNAEVCTALPCIEPLRILCRWLISWSSNVMTCDWYIYQKAALPYLSAPRTAIYILKSPVHFYLAVSLSLSLLLATTTKNRHAHIHKRKSFPVISISVPATALPIYWTKRCYPPLSLSEWPAKSLDTMYCATTTIYGDAAKLTARFLQCGIMISYNPFTTRLA